MGIDVKKPRKDYEHTGYIGAAAGEPSRGISAGVGKLNKQFDKIGETQPVVGAVGGQVLDSVGGAATATTGLFKGNKRMIKEGALQMGKSALNTVTEIGGLNSLNQPPKAVTVQKPYYGGSEGMAGGLAERNAAGMDRGQNLVGAGVGVLGQAADQSYEMFGRGTALASTGIKGQDAAIANSVGAANQQIGSLAEAQQRAASQQLASQMVAQAASARGGNQAAAMQGAQAQGSANSLATNQQLGMMRLAEEQARQQRIMQANQSAAGMYGDRTALGYGTANASTGQMGQLGGTLGQLGTTTTGQYLGADTAQNTAQLNADSAAAQEQAKLDWERNKSAQSAKGGVIGLAGKVIGSFF